MRTSNDRYGKFIPEYLAYTNAQEGMEYEIGRKVALRRFTNLTGCRVGDIGCGPGTNGPELHHLGAAEVIGIDISHEELDKARQVDPASTYLHYDGVHLAEVLEDRPIDAFLGSFSFCTIPDPDLECMLRDMRRLLVPGGEVVIIEPNFQRALGVHYPGELHYHGRRYGVIQSGDHVRVTLGEGKNAVKLLHDIYRSHNDYRRLLTNAGFTIEVFEEVRPSDACDERWAKLARKYPPFLHIKAH